MQIFTFHHHHIYRIPSHDGRISIDRFPATLSSSVPSCRRYIDAASIRRLFRLVIIVCLCIDLGAHSAQQTTWRHGRNSVSMGQSMHTRHASAPPPLSDRARDCKQMAHYNNTPSKPYRGQGVRILFFWSISCLNFIKGSGENSHISNGIMLQVSFHNEVLGSRASPVWIRNLTHTPLNCLVSVENFLQNIQRFPAIPKQITIMVPNSLPFP